MDNSSKNKNDLLGEPHGTAAHKLRKLILFSLVQETHKDICYKCGNKILSVEELTVEHKLPWQQSENPKLSFFDLNNIAFSHSYCNKCETFPTAISKRKIGPTGTAWCKKHQQFLTVDKFYKSKTNWNGYSKVCKECDTKRSIGRNHNNKSLRSIAV